MPMLMNQESKKRLNTIQDTFEKVKKDSEFYKTIFCQKLSGQDIDELIQNRIQKILSRDQIGVNPKNFRR